MAQATISLSPNLELDRRMRTAAMTLAMMRSKAIVRDALRRKGTKLSLVPLAEITAMAVKQETPAIGHDVAAVADDLPVANPLKGARRERERNSG
jgi:hypothetical protein